MHRQLRALVILDGLIQNAGPRFQRTFADEPLLERLRIMPRDDMVDPEVRDKCNVLFRQWAAAYKSTPGLERIASLYKQLPQTNRKPKPAQSKVLRETEADIDNDSPPGSPAHAKSPPRPSTNASSSRPTPVPVTLPHTTPASSTGSMFKSKDKKGKRKPFNLEKEKPQMLQTIAQASVASTNLLNGLKLINREHQRVSENAEVNNRFETCKLLRRQILRYIQLVESDQWIGSLLSANDELVKALMAYEIMDKSIDDDSDSDTEAYEASKAAFARHHADNDAHNSMAGLSLNDTAPAKPPRPTSIPMPPPIPVAASKKPARDFDSEPEDDADENDPFSDKNAVKTPYIEKDGLTW